LFTKSAQAKKCEELIEIATGQFSATWGMERNEGKTWERAICQLKQNDSLIQLVEGSFW
jgi:hypothetical protein